MTTTVTETTRSSIEVSPLAPFPTALGLIVIVLFVSLLVEKEIFRAQARHWTHIARTLDIAIVPLGLVVSYVIIVRMLRIAGQL